MPFPVPSDPPESQPTQSLGPAQPMSREEFSAVVRDNHAALCAYARVITGGDGVRAKEIVQDAFVAAWNNIGKFDVTRDISSWLRGIIRNKWRELCRSNIREVSLSQEKLELIEHKLVEIEADRPEIFDRLVHCREQLPETLAASVKTFYDEELSTEEAAAQLDINGATLRKRLERARIALRECLERKVSQAH